MPTVHYYEGMDAAANAVGFAPPDADGLVGWFHLDDATQALRNRAEGGGDGVIDGSVTFGTGYASFATQNDRLRTALMDTAAITLLIVAKSSATFAANGNRPSLIGTYASQSGGIAGAAIQVTATPSAAPAATVQFGASRDAAGVPTWTPASITVADFSKWTFLAGIAKAGAETDGRRIVDMTNGVSGVATPATARAINVQTGNGGKISIGGFTSLMWGPHSACWGAIYSQALTQARIDKIYPFVQRRYADKFGIAF